MQDFFDLSIKLADKEESGGLGSLTPAEQTFFLVWWFEAELNNGGFDQFFDNSTGNHAVHTVSALDRIGATTCANIVRRACALFPDSTPSSDWNTRQEQLCVITDDDEEAFESLTTEFYEYPDDIGGLLAKYWETHGV
jgi:hypothetical protein